MKNHFHYPTLLLLFVLFQSTSFAQTKVLKAAQYLEVQSGKLISPAVFVIKDKLIEAINPTELPGNASIIDLGNQTILPGLMDMHTHITFDLDMLATAAVKESEADFALRGANNAKKTLLAGFTTIRNLGSDGFADIALDRGIKKGFVIGPEIFSAGHTIGITGGHADITGMTHGILDQDYRKGIADGKDGVTKAVRYQIKHGARVIKMSATAGVLSFEGSVGAQQLSFEEMQAIVEEANRHGLKVAAHAHGADGILAAVKAGVSSIEHGSVLTEEIIKEMAKRGTYLTPTNFLNETVNLAKLHPILRKKAEYVISVSTKSLEDAIKGGVPIVFGTDAGVMKHGENAKEFQVMVKAGMTPLAAIKAATINAAQLLGITDRGALEVGKLADIIGVAGNPLENIRLLEQVNFVMKRGAVFKHNRQFQAPIAHSFFVAGPSFTGIIGENGAIIWDAEKPAARDGYVLENGHILICWSKEVREYDRNKKVIFSYQLGDLNKELGTAERLANGNTLITELGEQPRLLEVNTKGEVVVNVPLQPETDNAHMQTRMARKLANGNYLVPHLLAFAVKEYTPNGKIVQTFKTDLPALGGRAAKNWPFTAIRLANGNTLINLTNGNKTIEVDNTGKVIWKISNEDVEGTPFDDPCGAQRLPNGHTVIASYHAPEGIKLFEVTPQKEIVWQYEGPHRVHHFQILTTNGQPIMGKPLK